MKVLISELQAKLKEKGYRYSRLRELMLQIIEKSEKPINVNNILENLLNFDLKPNKTSVYREIETLLQEKIIRQIDLLDGFKRYEINLHSQGTGHSHFVCTDCGDTKCLELANELNSLETQIEQKFKFTINQRVLEFFGLCEKCF
jgi:Fur family transcriptional regulator, ferric uptake regulator